MLSPYIYLYFFNLLIISILLLNPLCYKRNVSYDTMYIMLSLPCVQAPCSPVLLSPMSMFALPSLYLIFYCCSLITRVVSFILGVLSLLSCGISQYFSSWKSEHLCPVLTRGTIINAVKDILLGKGRNCFLLLWRK